ncbi:MAG: hypothetical protein HXY25_06485, partial [Alphaproteobacteria bacterium]|nr:hypothetical protein [Alphaproteobacteria bacterium]
MSFDISLAPLLPWPALAALAALSLGVVALGLARARRGGLWRLLAVLLVLLALCDPRLIQEQREPLTDVAVLAIDRSPSQAIGTRSAETEAAAGALREALGRLEGLELREVTLTGTADGTLMAEALADQLTDVSPDRVAGVIVVSDGQIHDAPAEPAALPFEAPLHLLLTGRPDERDLRLVVEEAPRFGLIGQVAEIVMRVEALGPRPDRLPDPLMTARIGGETIFSRRVKPGERLRLPVRLDHAGPNLVEMEVEGEADEISLQNNRAIVSVNGVRDRLKVLLVSGKAYQGERAWRNLLKSDPAVDLVHFTILRPPTIIDPTPQDELALIEFPTEELFSERINDFELIIFDRYELLQVLQFDHFQNVADYVERGGALLVVAGPDFAGRASLYRTPLARVLPARPTGRVTEVGYRPALTEAGRRHPVTAPLEPAESAGWGRWFRTVEAETSTGDVVMTGADGGPLLVLSRVGEGRVAQLLSDQAWLWARGFEGGGPQVQLMRRLAHWLMKEPDLDEEALMLHPAPGGLIVRRRTLGESAAPVRVTRPDGSAETLPLAPEGPGLFSALLAAEVPGIYRAEEGTLSAVAALGEATGPELADMRATQERLGPA